MNEPPPQNYCLKQKLEQKLESTECPFTWMPNRKEFEDIKPSYILEYCELKPHNGNLTIYSKYMRRIFELKNQDDPNVMQVMQEWEEMFFNIDASDKCFAKYNTALKHVLYSSKAHLLLKMQDYNQVEQLIESIEILNDDSNHFKAGISGLKANFFYKYCRDGRLKALPDARKAMELDPEEPKWINLTAKTMRGIRTNQIKGTMQSRYEELKLFEKLVSIEKKGTYLIHLGNSYIDVGNYLEYEKRAYHERAQYDHWCGRHSSCSGCKTIQNYFFNGAVYFKEAITVDPNLYIYGKVVKGINAIPRFYSSQIPLVRRTAETCVNNIVDNIDLVNDVKYGFDVYYSIGKYYKNLGKNPQEGWKYIRKSAELGGRHAKKDLICLMYNENSSYDPHDDIKELMDVYECGPMRVECLCQLASYHLFNDDLLKALEYVLQVKEYDPSFNHPYVKRLRSWFNQRRNVNLLKEITFRVLSRLQKLDNEDTSQEKKKLTNFIMEVMEIALLRLQELDDEGNSDEKKKLIDFINGTLEIVLSRLQKLDNENASKEIKKLTNFIKEVIEIALSHLDELDNEDTRDEDKMKLTDFKQEIRGIVLTHLQELGNEDTSDEKKKILDFIHEVKGIIPETVFSGLNLGHD